MNTKKTNQAKSPKKLELKKTSIVVINGGMVANFKFKTSGIPTCPLSTPGGNCEGFR